MISLQQLIDAKETIKSYWLQQYPSGFDNDIIAFRNSKGYFDNAEEYVEDPELKMYKDSIFVNVLKHELAENLKGYFKLECQVFKKEYGRNLMEEGEEYLEADILWEEYRSSVLSFHVYVDHVEMTDHNGFIKKRAGSYSEPVFKTFQECNSLVDFLNTMFPKMAKMVYENAKRVGKLKSLREEFLKKYNITVESAHAFNERNIEMIIEAFKKDMRSYDVEGFSTEVTKNDNLEIYFEISERDALWRNNYLNINKYGDMELVLCERYEDDSSEEQLEETKKVLSTL